MDWATTVSDVIYKYLRPLIRQHVGAWSETAGVAGPDFQQVYVEPPQERIGSQMKPRVPTVERLVDHLTMDRNDTLILLTGQKGSGKTFALRRMYDDPAIKARFHRVFIRATGEDLKTGLPAGDADLRLLLLLLCAEVSREFNKPELKAALKQHGARVQLEETLKQWVALLEPDGLPTPQNFSDYAAKINVVAAELSWKTRSDDQRRRSLRLDETFAPSQLIRVLSALVRALRDTVERIDPTRDLLLVVDDADKYASREEAESMFLQGTHTLREVPCKMVLTFPYWLHFDPRYNNLAADVTREVLSNVKVVTRDAPDVPLEPAMAFFREMFHRIASPQVLESDDVLKEAALLAAGVPREFLRVLAGAFGLANEFKEPVLTLETLRDAKIILAREPIATSSTLAMRARLKYVSVTRTIPTARFWELLDSLHVVEYVNDRPWYAVNPLLRDWVDEQVREDRKALSDRGVKSKDIDDQLKARWLEVAASDD